MSAIFFKKNIKYWKCNSDEFVFKPTVVRGAFRILSKEKLVLSDKWTTWTKYRNTRVVWRPLYFHTEHPAGIYLFKVNNWNVRKVCEIYSKIIIKTPERRQRHRSGVFIVDFEQISVVLVFPLRTLNN